MKRKMMMVFVGFALVAGLCFACGTANHNVTSVSLMGTPNHNVKSVSLMQLIVNPEKYHGKLVRVISVSRIEFEGDGVWFTKEHYKHRIYKNSLWIEPDYNALGATRQQLDQPFTITIDQLAQLTEKELNLTFLEVLEDSRCPSNVECAEAGQARISINVTQIGQTPATLEMNTNPPLKQDVVTYENFQIRLLALNPYPEDIDQHIPMETYEAILVITDSP